MKYLLFVDLKRVVCYYIEKFNLQVNYMSENAELQNQTIEENKNVDVTDEAEYDEEYTEEYYEEDYEESKFRIILHRVFNKKIIFSVLAIVISVIVVSEAIIGVVLSSTVFNPRKFTESEKSQEIIRKPLSEQSYIDWMNTKGAKVNLKNSEGYTLNGVELKNHATSHSYVIMFHPYTANVTDMAVYAYRFFDMGFNVLVTEARGCGESEYKNNTFGYLERYDVVDWAKMVSENDKDSAIFLFGLGSGGSSLLMASSLEMPSNVKGIISDSAYGDLNEVFKINAKELYNAPAFPVVNFGSLYTKVTLGFSFKDVDVIEQVRNSKLPILFIHGGDDSIVPVDQSNDLYEACTVKGSEHLYVNSADHCGALARKTDKYWFNVDSFVLENIEN